jgi:uncharacterized protein YbcI
MTEGDETTVGIAQSLLVEVSREIGAIYKDKFGRGPTRARTYWSGPDALTVLLENTLTPLERSLVEAGEHQRLRDMRTFLQYAAGEELIEPIERLTGRKVRSFISGIDTHVDGLSVETFVLHDESYDGPSRSESQDAQSQ